MSYLNLSDILSLYPMKEAVRSLYIINELPELKRHFKSLSYERSSKQSTYYKLPT